MTGAFWAGQSCPSVEINRKIIPTAMELYVKKLVSLNPDAYDYIPLSKAIKSYGAYVGLMVEGSEKSFEEWCATEI